MLCHRLTREQCNTLYIDAVRSGDTKALRRLCKEDLFFFLLVACNRKDINKDWLYERCREVEANPNGYVDLWAREHYKSTIVTFALTIQDILNDPEITFGIFSHTRPIAKGFMEQIKRELEDNTFLKNLFPDVLFQDPKNQAPKWSLDGGLIVKRQGNPKESTIEAWGLVDGQPTSKHFGVLLYDDVVTEESVTTPDQIAKTTKAWELSDNLGKHGGAKRHVGTFYHFNDTYRSILERMAAIARIYPATKDGKYPGIPVLLTPEQLDKKRISQGPYVFSCQMLLDPVADKAMAMREEWLRFYDDIGETFNMWNLYVLVDPANEKKRDNDYTVIVVIALAPDKNYYLIEGFRDRVNLRERTKKVFEFVRKYQPIKVGYEKYGMQADIEHIQYEMELQNYRFEITPLAGQMAKFDRVRKLTPIFSQGRFWLPHKCLFIDSQGKVRDFVNEFIKQEYLAFPVAVHDDMLDCKARILDKDLGAEFPEEIPHTLSVTYNREPERVKTEYDVLNRKYA